MTGCLQYSVKKKLITDYNAYKNDTKHNHGFSLRPLIRDEADPKWGLEWTAKIFCTDDIFKGSKFVLKITLSNDFPTSPPRLQFMKPSPFHPNVEQGSGSLCYRLLDYDWPKNNNITIPAWFLANPNFPGGYNQDPKKLHTESDKKYYAKVKELSSIKV